MKHPAIKQTELPPLAPPSYVMARRRWKVSGDTRAGKVLYGGLSNYPAWRVALAANTADLRGWASITALQAEYNLLQRTTERELRMGWAWESWRGPPWRGGLLTGKYRRGEKGRATELKGSVLPQEAEKREAVLDVLFSVAQELGATPGQVALS